MVYLSIERVNSCMGVTDNKQINTVAVIKSLLTKPFYLIFFFFLKKAFYNHDKFYHYHSYSYLNFFQKSRLLGLIINFVILYAYLPNHAGLKKKKKKEI